MGTSRPTVTLPNSKRLDDSSNNENNNKSVISNSNKNNERNDDYEATVDQGAASKAADKSRPPTERSILRIHTSRNAANIFFYIGRLPYGSYHSTIDGR